MRFEAPVTSASLPSNDPGDTGTRSFPSCYTSYRILPGLEKTMRPTVLLFVSSGALGRSDETGPAGHCSASGRRGADLRRNTAQGHRAGLQDRHSGPDGGRNGHGGGSGNAAARVEEGGPDLARVARGKSAAAGRALGRQP